MFQSALVDINDERRVCKSADLPAFRIGVSAFEVERSFFGVESSDDGLT